MLSLLFTIGVGFATVIGCIVLAPISIALTVVVGILGAVIFCALASAIWSI